MDWADKAAEKILADSYLTREDELKRIAGIIRAAAIAKVEAKRGQWDRLRVAANGELKMQLALQVVAANEILALLKGETK